MIGLVNKKGVKVAPVLFRLEILKVKKRSKQMLKMDELAEMKHDGLKDITMSRSKSCSKLDAA